MTTYITKMFDRLDRICYERYGSTNNGEVEFVLASNPGLEAHGIILPLGISIELPERPPAPDPVQVIQTIQLWS